MTQDEYDALVKKLGPPPTLLGAKSDAELVSRLRSWNKGAESNCTHDDVVTLVAESHEAADRIITLGAERDEEKASRLRVVDLYRQAEADLNHRKFRELKQRKRTDKAEAERDMYDIMVNDLTKQAADSDAALVRTQIDLAAAHQQIEAAMAALKPFAQEASRYDPDDDGDDGESLWDYAAGRLRLGDLRRARYVLVQLTKRLTDAGRETEKRGQGKMTNDWVLVPREPTEAMLDVGMEILRPRTRRIALYQSMLAASPAPAMPVGDDVRAYVRNDTIGIIRRAQVDPLRQEIAYALIEYVQELLDRPADLAAARQQIEGARAALQKAAVTLRQIRDLDLPRRVGMTMREAQVLANTWAAETLDDVQPVLASLTDSQTGEAGK